MKIKRQKFVLGLQASIAVLAIWWFSNFQGHCQAKWILVYVKNNATRLQIGYGAGRPSSNDRNSFRLQNYAFLVLVSSCSTKSLEAFPGVFRIP